jgi:hypothetical protein
MDQVVPWKSLLNLIEPCYPMACRGTIDHRQRQQHVLQPVALSERPLSTAPNDNKGSGVPVGSWREQSLPASAPDGNECQVPERS